MKIYHIEPFKPETAREIADIEDGKYTRANAFTDEMDDDEYEMFVKANGRDDQYYAEFRMFYGFYKEFYKNCMTKPDSYDPDTKTIVVYVHNWRDMEAHRQFYDLIHKQ